MSIALSDNPQSVADYLNQQVTTTVGAITPNKPNQDVLTPGQDGSTTITATNAAAPDGIRLVDIVYHVKISDDSVAVLIPPSSAIVHSSHDIAGNDPVLATERPPNCSSASTSAPPWTPAPPAHRSPSTCTARTRARPT